MSRDVNGNYTLPAGNPVTPNTVIESAWANSTMPDIATALSDSLSRSGLGGMLAPFKNAAGTKAAPGMTWTAEPTSGWYRKTVNEFWYSVGNEDVFKIDKTGIALAPGKTFPGAGGTAETTLFTSDGLGAKQTNLKVITQIRAVNVADFKVTGVGDVTPLSNHYATLAAAQADFPFVTSLTQQWQWACVQAAVNYACSGVNPSLYNRDSPWNGASTMLWFGTGYYDLNDEVTVPGAIHICGPGGNSYSGARIVINATGKNLFRLTADTDGAANSTVFSDLTLRQITAGANPNVALVTATEGISGNSLWFRGVFFQNPEMYAIYLPQGDDIQIQGCTFDVCNQGAIKLGKDSTHKVTNARITNNTFYDVIQRSCIELIEAENIIISLNNAYGSAPYGGAGVLHSFIDCTGANYIANVAVLGNNVRTWQKAATITGNNWNFCNNTFTEGGYGSKQGVELFATLENLMFCNNQIQGAFGTPAVLNGGSATVNGCIVTGNRLYSGSPATLAINLPNGSAQLVSGNNFTGFTTQVVSTGQGIFPTVWSTAAGAAPVLGNGTLEMRFNVLDNTISVECTLTFGSTTTGGAGGAANYWIFSLPVANINLASVGSAVCVDSFGAFHNATSIVPINGTSAVISVDGPDLVNATNPFVWGSGDSLTFNLTYQFR